MGVRTRKTKKFIMLVYTCKKTGDEMLSDSCPIEELCGGELFRVKGKMITVGGEDFVLEGANASAEEEADAGGEAETEQVIDIIHAFKLSETEFTKKEYVGYIKSFIKNYMVLPMKADGVPADEIATFKTNVMEAVTLLTAKGTFEEFRFWTSEEMDPEGNIAMLYYGDEEGTLGKGAHPWFYFIKNGMKSTKC